MIDGLYAKNPFNVVRIIQNKKEPSDASNGDRHNRPPRFFPMGEGRTLIRDETPRSIFTGSGLMARRRRTHRIHANRSYRISQLVDYEDGIIFPTNIRLSGPKSTGTNSFRPQKPQRADFRHRARRRWPALGPSPRRSRSAPGGFTDNDGVRHTLYRTTIQRFLIRLKAPCPIERYSSPTASPV